VLDPLFRQHVTGRSHPESPRRVAAVEEGLASAGLLTTLARVKATDCPLETLHGVHLATYVETVKREVEAGRHLLSTGDTAICPASYAVALRAAGGVANAVDWVMAGQRRRAFCALRPPGHHAGAGRGMGFCIFNNAAIAAKHAQRKHGLERVLIVDWDVHHGNGTQDLFYEDGSVLFFSTHQWPWYPGTGPATETGVGAGKGLTINVPMPAGAGDRELIDAFREKLVPAAHAFGPELVVISAGFDSRAGDPLGRFQVTDAGFRRLTETVMGIASRHAGGRVVSTLEGGYDLAGLASAAAAHVRALMG